MPGAGPHAGSDEFIDVRRIVRVGKIPCVLLCRETDHDAQPVACGNVEQVMRWHGVRNADGVEAGLRHLREITVDQLDVLVLALVLVRPKGAVGRTAHPELA